MKKYIILFAAIFFLPLISAQAQLKIAYVDSDAIMKKLPDAQDAQKRIDAMVQEWQGELKNLENDWKTKYDDYEKRKLIMSAQTRSETEQELIKLEKAVSDYRQKKFGVEGELFQKQDELMKPVQNRVFDAIDKIAKDEDLDFVFDRSGDVVFLYAKEEYDITNKVLESLK
jgi:outer membrane protein